MIKIANRAPSVLPPHAPIAWIAARARAHLSRALLLLFALSAAPLLGQAPEDDPLVSDRPDFTESAVTVASGRVQVEAGATITQADAADVVDLGEVLLRIGLADRLELRIGISSYARVEPKRGPDASGFTDASVGLKLGLGESSGWTTALLAAATLPSGSSEFREPHPQPSVVLAAQRDLNDSASLGVNLGHTRASDGDERFGEWSGSAALGVPLSPRTGAFFELFGIVPASVGGPETYFFNGGITHALGPDLQLDLRAGAGLNSAADDFFAGVGVVWRR